jgi:mRNA interferase MazF
MRRGDIVTVAFQGDFGKPRPAIVIESDRLPPTESTPVCLITSTLLDDATFRRQPIEASPSTGLRAPSQIMVDKIFAVRRSNCGPSIGVLDKAAMRTLDRKMALVIGLAD